MTEGTYLGGNILKRTLPTVQPTPVPAAGSPVLKRLMLPQGELAQICDGSEPFRYLAFIELKAGSARGNHYHNAKDEWVYLIRGSVSLEVQEVTGGPRESIPLIAGDLVRIPPGVAHALKVVESGQAVEFSSQRFDPEDIHRFPLS